MTNDIRVTLSGNSTPLLPTCPNCKHDTAYRCVVCGDDAIMREIASLRAKLAEAEARAGRAEEAWRKAEPGQTFEDGDLILCAVPLMPSGFDYCVLSVACDDSGFFRLNYDGEPWGWDWSDVAWWKPCQKAPAVEGAKQ